MQTKNRKILIIVVAALLVFTTLSFNSVFIANTDAASKMPYLVKVNKSQNCVTIYEKDNKGEYTVPVKAMICSVGYATPLGTFKTPEKYRWKLLMEDVWGQYSTRITGGILFHSVWYYQMDNSTLSAQQYNKLGTTASHGCVRLTTIDAKWIYDNCPVGTTVTIYEDKNPGPLGKPEALKIPLTSGWDPTDPDTKNPWLKKEAKIVGVKDVVVEWGQPVSVLSGVTAFSKTNTDITKDIVVTGSVNVKKAGKYTITYKVTDLSGSTDTKRAVFTVKNNESSPTLSGVKNRTVNKTTKVDRNFVLTGVSASWNNKKIDNSKITTKISYDNTRKQYLIEYLVTADNKKTKKAAATITVDDTPPVITGVCDVEMDEWYDITKDYVLADVEAYDNNVKMDKSLIKTNIVYSGNDSYTVTYTVTDNVGNTTKKTAMFYYITYEETYIYGAFDREISSADDLNESMALDGVTAECNGIDITDLIEVFITPLKDGNYKITYSVINQDGYEKIVSVIFYIK